MPILNPAPAWRPARSRYLTVWHGCTSDDKNDMEKYGIDVTVGRVDADFGRGFYTTTIERQARHWAWTRFYDPRFRRKSGVQPAVLRFRIDRHQLAELTLIAFVLGAYDNLDYWSLVRHCRQSTATAVHDHKGPVREGGNGWYDLELPDKTPSLRRPTSPKRKRGNSLQPSSLTLRARVLGFVR